MAWLDDNPPVRSQFRCPRREQPSGLVVVHTAESTPDFVAFDGGAEAVARFIRTRPDPGSYHDIADSDSFVQLVRYDCEAFHDGTGSNPHSYGVSAATRADVWPLAPADWRARCVANMAACAARYATWLRSRRGIVIPARRITRDESELRVPGFISHAERDPTRRTDPGPEFPWDAFLAEYARLTATPPAPVLEDDDMFVLYDPSNGTHWLVFATGRVQVSGDFANRAKAAGFKYLAPQDADADAILNAVDDVAELVRQGNEQRADIVDALSPAAPAPTD